jgi:CHAT domain-containing protein/tetratricopeptide (TPR) repeat protein
LTLRSERGGFAALLVVCLVTGTVADQLRSATDSEQTPDRVRQEIDGGNYTEAERLARALYAQADPKALDSPPTINALEVLVEALVANGKGGAETTLTGIRRVISARELALAPEHIELSGSLHVLGSVYVERGDFRAALAAHERALKIRLKSLREDDPAVADSLDHVALPSIRLEKFADAKAMLAQSMQVRESRSEQDPIALANTLELVALLHRYSSNGTSGLEAIDRALAIRSKLTPQHPAIVSLRHVRGDILWLQGQTPEAQREYESALALSQATLDPNHPIVAVLLRKLGSAAAAFGNLAEARRLRERAVALSAVSLAPCHPEASGVLSDLAVSFRAEGEYIEAEKLYRRVLAVREKCLGVHSLTATVVYNLANLLFAMGDLADAERLYARAGRDWAASLGPTHRYVAMATAALAETVANRGQQARAISLYKRALEIRRRSLPKDHPDIGSTLIKMATTADTMGLTTQALAWLDEAASIYSRARASEQPQLFSGLLTARGNIERRRGDYVAAHRSFSEALVQRERMYGAAHPLVAETRADLAAVELALGSPAVALESALTAEEIGREHLRATIRYLPERQALAYATKRPRALDLALSIAASDPDRGSTLLLDVVIQSRGVVLDELVSRSPTTHSSDPQMASEIASAIQARQRFANLVVRSMQETVSRPVLDEARQKSESAERVLAERRVESNADGVRTHVRFTDVDAALPAGSALVSFVNYDRTKLAPRGYQVAALTPVRSYGAFVHRAGSSDAAFVPLGTGAWIDGLIRTWRIEASGGSMATGSSAQATSASYRTAARALRRAVWDPLDAHLEGVKRLFIVPDGLLNIVNIAALPGRDGRYLIEGSSVFHYLSTERDLVTQSEQAPGRGLVAVGGPAFGGGPPAKTSTSPALRSACEGFGNINFEDLPGSRREVMEISRLWPAHGPDESTVLIGAAATETAVKKSFGGRRIIHLATHGFFLGEDCSSGTAGSRSVGGLTKKTSPTRATAKSASTAAENPLSLAGLAFAGANRRRSVTGDQDDGILTAEEIGGLNLQGTEWAVLSACDTGLGEIKAGEGVFGLRRAFQVAGARTVIMSLWSVEDHSAMDWMRALYEGRLRGGLDTAEAVREASLTVLRQRRARGQSTHPFFWAGFVASGDWR